MADVIRLLQEWYADQCDEDWEHSYGVNLDALDNARAKELLSMLQVKNLRRYWLTFSQPPEFSPLGVGCGITAYDRADALDILQRQVAVRQPGLTIDGIIEDVDVRQLDAGHVIPNMGLVTVRGVWFPLGY